MADIKRASVVRAVPLPRLRDLDVRTAYVGCRGQSRLRDRASRGLPLTPNGHFDERLLSKVSQLPIYSCARRGSYPR